MEGKIWLNVQRPNQERPLRSAFRRGKQQKNKSKTAIIGVGQWWSSGWVVVIVSSSSLWSRDSGTGVLCNHSVHVKVSLQDSLLEGIRLGPLRLLWLMLDGSSLDRGLRHLGDGLCPIVDRVAAGWRGGREREGRTSTSDGALGARPKLLGPVETLLVISGTAVGTNVAHVGSAKAHSSDERRSGRGLSGPKERIVVFNGVLVNRVGIVRVGRHAASSDE